MLYAVPLFDFLPGSIITMQYSRCEVEVVTLLEPQSQSRTAAGADWDPSTQDINTICSSVLQTVPTHTCTHTCLKIATCYLSETFLICECGIRSDTFPISGVRSTQWEARVTSQDGADDSWLNQTGSAVHLAELLFFIKHNLQPIRERLKRSELTDQRNLSNLRRKLQMLVNI